MLLLFGTLYGIIADVTASRLVGQARAAAGVA